MIKAIFYKEWLKTRWYYVISSLTLLGFTLYSVLNIARVINLKGAEHIWGVMLQKDVILVDMLRFVPLIIGILFAVVQFVPEMNKKCIKLTLHLPYSQFRMIFTMLLSGLIMLLFTFLVNIAVLWIYLDSEFAVEMVRHILLTAVIWYLAGVASYVLVAWVCLEPSWGRRVVNLIISTFVLKLFFMSATPEAYNQFIGWLCGYTILALSLPWLSVIRFKEGKQ